METIQVPLTKGYVAIIDAADAHLLGGFKWTAMVHAGGRRVYAYRREWPSRQMVLLHRVITGAAHGFDVDHINHDALDNRRVNLRVCTRSENLANRRVAAGSGGFRGITKTRQGRWRAQVSSVTQGVFSTPEEAARAYDAAALAKFGEFATLNFPHGHTSAALSADTAKKEI
jgi:hypothetical protein